MYKSRVNEGDISVKVFGFDFDFNKSSKWI